MALTLGSTAFEQGKEIPSRFTCEGDNISPPLQWKGVPPSTRSLVLIVDDPDAPDPKAPQRLFVHWVLCNIPPHDAAIHEGISAEKLPSGTREGLNDRKKPGYIGPCPPIGRHRYFFRLYALDVMIENQDQPSRTDIDRAMAGHILEMAELMGTYQKHN
jgi:Raf kinase inhibitor-like YbhB/YbcL family protein